MLSCKVSSGQASSAQHPPLCPRCPSPPRALAVTRLPSRLVPYTARSFRVLCSLPAVRIVHFLHPPDPPPPRFHLVQQELPRFWQELQVPCFEVRWVHLVRQELPCFWRVLKRVQVVLSYPVDRDSNLHLSPTSCLLNSVINPPIHTVLLTHLDSLSLDARTRYFGQEKSHNDIIRFRSQYCFLLFQIPISKQH